MRVRLSSTVLNALLFAVALASSAAACDSASTAGGDVTCPSPIAVTNYKGYHTGPYRPRLLFIDPNDLGQVARGARAPNTFLPYVSHDPSRDWPWTSAASRRARDASELEARVPGSDTLSSASTSLIGRKSEGHKKANGR